MKTRLPFSLAFLLLAACGEDPAPKGPQPSDSDNLEQDAGVDAGSETLDDAGTEPSSDAGEEDVDASQPPAQKTQLQQVYGIFQKHCALCHVDTDMGVFQYNSTASFRAAVVYEYPKNPLCLESVYMLVEPGNPDNSLLIRKLEGTQDCGDPMPFAPNAPLSDEEIAVVRQWVADGAPLN